MSQINWNNKCWVTTIYLVMNDKVLLTWNKNLQTWIPVGGHIDPGEDPEEAIKREVAEEIGCSFEFLKTTKYEENGKLKILGLHRFQIEEVHHHNKHMNFVFFGKVLYFDHNKDKTDEEEKLKWFSEEELNNENIIMLDGVRKNGLAAIHSSRIS